MSFDTLGLEPDVLRSVHDKGYSNPTPIQEQAIPIALTGKDLIGSAQTGTGKTAAFCLPALSLLKAHNAEKSPRCLILEPTRELAGQVDDNLELYGKHLDLKVALIHGGVKYGGQEKALEEGADIVVATPGRLLDHMEKGNISLAGIEILILDEVDRMLDMGFIEDVNYMVSQCPKERQTLFFSATVPDPIKKLADTVLTDPASVELGGRRAPAETVDHAIYPVDAIQKFDLLVSMIERMDYDSVLIFTRTKIDADRITRWLKERNHPVVTMHSDRTQAERKAALEGFKSGKYEILVATDIASRGLDISGITHVINYNVPQHCEDYVHRIGRTGRAAKEGEAFTLFSTDETSFLSNIENFIGKTIPRRKWENFHYRNEPLLNSPPPRKRRNRGYSGPGTSFGRR
ncbi:DEAD/DEAH box helicase [Rubellicoccus peritrichatus]|uniref:DEAD-box ATP-dependent RNA helicase RhpA n=1 Tax=Rubellicoccus peritrichatus TaxID=3080537 RepID=A0AAQ3QTS5_9BACT|nr:DEAD/DEAH box helicase [Puniceicoccus sp. CR14]WOO41641.1 DEAD/DEAH box helicase [Puniceicoccus sp. CR14]